MKKLFTFVLALFAMIYVANAQVTVILEAHNVWGDGTGYQLLLDADHNAYGTTIPTSGGLTSSGDASASVYAEFEYKIPTNADGSMSTQNMILDGSASITIPAGTYDYCITNPTPGDRIWIASSNGTQPGRGDDFVFEDGKTYHFLVGRVGSNDGVTLTVTMNPTTPTIDAPATVDFGTVLLNNSATQNTSINAYLLTNSITATTAAPFEVSADGTTFGTSATLDTTGGALYIKYTPTAAGTDNETVILSSVGANNDTIILTGNCLDCSNITLPYTCDFSDASLNQCWTVIDANNDGYTFTMVSGEAAYHWHSTNTADDWLISPSFSFDGQLVTYDHKSSSSWAEKYEVFAIGTDTVRLTQPITLQEANFVSTALDVSSLNGNYSIAFHCISDPDKYYLRFTNFQVIDAASAVVTLDADTLNYGTLAAGTTLTGYFNIATTNLNEVINVTTNAPFELSLNDTTYSSSIVIPADSNLTTSTQVYVRFAPTAAGTFNDMVLVTTSTTADTLIVMGIAVECNAITTFPFVETFDNTSTSRPCWEIVDNNNDGKTFRFGTVGGEWVAACPYHTTNPSDDYLISPEFTLTSGLYGHVDYAAYSASYPEKMSVYVIPENGTIANAVNIVPTFTFNNTYSDGFETLNFDLSAYTNQTVRIAIKAESDANKYYVFVDNFTIENLPEASLTVTPTTMSFNGIMNTPTGAQTASVSATSLSNDISVAVTGPFEVSTDGTTFAATATIAQASVVNATLYVRMNATTAGAQNGTVTLTSGANNATITLSGSATDCSGAHSLPFTENFNGDIVPPTCWSYNDAESFDRATVDEDAGDYAIYISNPDMLVTPELTSAEPMHVNFGYRSYLGNYGTSTFRVGYSSTNNNASSFTWLSPVSINAYPDDDVLFFDFNSDLPANTKYIAIEVLELGTYSYYSDVIFIDNFLVDNELSINEYNDNVSVYPNPANNMVTVNATSNINTVEVFNMMGQRVAAFDANDTNIQINTTALSNGMYMMRITTENGVSNQKLMIAR